MKLQNLLFSAVFATALFNTAIAQENFIKTYQNEIGVLSKEVSRTLHSSKDEILLIDAEKQVKLISQLMKLRENGVAFGQMINDKIKKDLVLTGSEIQTLKDTVDLYILLNKQIVEISEKNIVNKDINEIMDPKSTDLLKQHLISTAGLMYTLDNFRAVKALYFDNTKVRRIVKLLLKDKRDHYSVNSTRVEEIIGLTQRELKLLKKAHLKKELSIFKNKFENSTVELSDEYIFLSNTLFESKTTSDILHGDLNVSFNPHSISDTLNEFTTKTVNEVSKGFGNLSGSVKYRKGYFHGQEKFHNIILNKLKPLDIILEKTPFILTDTFIPGHFGHVAIYLGTKEQLQEINMWDSEFVKPFQKDIENGKVIIEALRTGVHLAKVEEFMNIDLLALIRKNNLSEKSHNDIENHYKVAFEQLGKKYDFNFDVTTLDKIVCSELIYHVFGEVQWPTTYRLSRPTISPDQVAEILFTKDSKFSLVAYYEGLKSNFGRNTYGELFVDDLAKSMGYQKVPQKPELWGKIMDEPMCDSEEKNCKKFVRNFHYIEN